MHIDSKTYPWLYLAALFKISLKRKQPKCPSPDESINENMNEHLSHFLEVQSLSLAFEAIVLMSLIKPHLYVFYSAATF